MLAGRNGPRLRPSRLCRAPQPQGGHLDASFLNDCKRPPRGCADATFPPDISSPSHLVGTGFALTACTAPRTRTTPGRGPPAISLRGGIPQPDRLRSTTPTLPTLPGTSRPPRRSILFRNSTIRRASRARRARSVAAASPYAAKIGAGSGMSFASFRRFGAVAANRNSSLAPFGPRKRSRSSLRIRFR